LSEPKEFETHNILELAESERFHMSNLIRLVTPKDCEEILSIYAPYIEKTTISFEQVVPSIDDFRKRVETISKQYPYLVYESNGHIVGYAYATQHGSRYAFRFSVDLSVYIRDTYQGMGIAKKLYDCLFEILKQCNYVNAYVAYTETNEKSRIFHEKYGFTSVTTFRKVGYKFGQWQDLTWAEKAIRPHTDHPGEIIPIGDLSFSQIYRFCVFQ
jgi:phosphinothricin acetyltransferase